MKRQASVTIDGRTLVLSNLDKVFYPTCGFTKGQVIDYYARIAPSLLPHLRGRPLTLKRYPEGVEGLHFYEKRCPPHRPAWIHTASIGEGRAEGPIDYCLARDLPSLIWAVNLADLEMHTSLALARSIGRPTVLAFDLDPGAPADVVDCAEVALWLRAILDGLGLASFAKSSGQKGLQVYVPLNTATSYEETKPFAHAIAQLLERAHPERVTSLMKKSLRPGKVFVDWSQNDEHKTTVTVYSLRARARPTVSTPLGWDEVEACVAERDARLVTFETDAVLARVEALGDRFAPVLTMKQMLPRVGTAERPVAAARPGRGRSA